MNRASSMHHFLLRRLLLRRLLQVPSLVVVQLVVTLGNLRMWRFFHLGRYLGDMDAPQAGAKDSQQIPSYINAQNLQWKRRRHRRANCASK